VWLVNTKGTLAMMAAAMVVNGHGGVRPYQMQAGRGKSRLLLVACKLAVVRVLGGGMCKPVQARAGQA